MEIAVCDDDTLDRVTAARMLRQSLRECGTGGGITCFSNGLELLYEIQDGKIFDAVFLDIYMDKIMGIDVARQLRAGGYKGKIVFLTASRGFAVESYEVKAAGYLLKPACYVKLSAVVRDMLSDMECESYHFRHRGDILSVHYDEIIFVESSNSKCLLHCLDGAVHPVYKRLSDIEEELCDSRFLRCHQSYLVNMNHIVSADKNFETDTGETVLIRQKSLREMKNRYLEFIG